MNPAALGVDDNAAVPVLYMALELGNKTWKVAFSDGVKGRRRTVDAGDVCRLREEVERSRARFGLEPDVRVVSCYEAGRDGFWLHRYLVSVGVKNAVVDSSSIEGLQLFKSSPGLAARPRAHPG